MVRPPARSDAVANVIQRVLPAMAKLRLVQDILAVMVSPWGRQDVELREEEKKGAKGILWDDLPKINNISIELSLVFCTACPSTRWLCSLQSFCYHCCYFQLLAHTLSFIFIALQDVTQ